ncbi:MAG: aminotransferase class IV [Syntrophobacteraceae bacterium]
MPIHILSFDEVIDLLIASNQPHFTNYLAMYSSWYGGIITDPALMMVPLDDHLVHRGDGIFEAFTCRNWNIYALERHLNRLDQAAAAFGLNIPVDRPGMVEIIRETIRAGNSGTCLVRLFVSRGPGGFSANPYESVASQVYVVVTALNPPAAEKYARGVALMTSSIPVKTDYFATIKTCNYLPNVLMKKEARDAGADYPVSLDEHGFLAEGATENIGVLTRGGEFLTPRFCRILRGITVTRTLELARALVGRELTAIAEADIAREQAYAAAEMFIFGTSLNILPVVEYDGKKIGGGRPGPVYKKLLELFLEDESTNKEMLTDVR